MEMDISETIGRTMLKRRKELRMSLDDVAKIANCSKSHIWEMEHGRAVNPTIKMLISIAKALSTSIDNLIGQDISQPILSDDELELIQHHRRIFKRSLDETKMCA